MNSIEEIIRNLESLSEQAKDIIFRANGLKGRENDICNDAYAKIQQHFSDEERECERDKVRNILAHLLQAKAHVARSWMYIEQIPPGIGEYIRNIGG
jgi:hypothetical protein